MISTPMSVNVLCVYINPNTHSTTHRMQTNIKKVDVLIIINVLNVNNMYNILYEKLHIYME